MASPSSSPEPRPVPSGRRVAGSVRVPSSKSVSHRYLNLALLARAPLTLERPLLAEDIELALAALETCGFAVDREQGGEAVRLVPGPVPSAGRISCGNAGTLLRFLTATLATVDGDWILDGTPRLRERPVGPLVAALKDLGAHIEFAGRRGFPPLRIRGGKLAGGTARLDAGESSQYLSALLMAALAAHGPVAVEVTALTSAPYVALTLEAAAAFGGRIREQAPGHLTVEPGLAPPARLEVEGDFSAACYPAAAAALTGGEVRLIGLRPGSAQGDRAFFDLLAAMGARVEWSGEEVVVGGGRELEAVEEDLASMPDQVPTLAALAPFARGTTRVTRVAHLRIKESDRLAAMVEELGRLGVAVEELADGLAVPGVWAHRRPPAAPVTVDPHGDHRIAMSLALVGLRRPGVSVARPEVVAKSYPAFWQDLTRLLR